MKKYFRLFGHDCEVATDRSPESRDGWLRAKAIDFITINPTSNLTLQHFNSYATIVNERRRQLQLYLTTIHPFSQFKFLWEVMMLGWFLLGMWYAPMLFLLYFDDSAASSVGNLTIMWSVKIACIIDMIIRFFMGYWDDLNFVVSFRRMHRMFLIQFISSSH